MFKLRIYHFVLVVLITASPVTTQAATYYVDSVAGHDSNSGTSLLDAWASLLPMNTMMFLPGDQILFKAGTSYAGQFKPQGSGTVSNPIRVDLYGSGEKPIIDGA